MLGKKIKVYRLLVAKTYEMHMFKTASKKLGLDQAVLSGSRPRKAQDKAAPTAKEVSEKKRPRVIFTWLVVCLSSSGICT